MMADLVLSEEWGTYHLSDHIAEESELSNVNF